MLSISLCCGVTKTWECQTDIRSLAAQRNRRYLFHLTWSANINLGKKFNGVEMFLGE